MSFNLLSKFKSLLLVLDTKQRRQLYRLQVLLVIASLFEVIGVASIGPFLALVGNPDLIQENAALAWLYQQTGLASRGRFLIFLGASAVLLMLIGTLFSMLSSWRQVFFAWRVGIEVGNKLFNQYLHQNWLFHTRKTSAESIKQVSVEAVRLAQSVFIPLLRLNSRLCMSLLMLLVLIWINPLLIFILVVSLSIVYGLVFYWARKPLGHYGSRSSANFKRRQELLQEGFGGIKEVLLMNQQQQFKGLFKSSGAELAESQAMIDVLIQLPRFAIELVVFAAIILSVVLLLFLGGAQNINLVGSLGVFAVSALKLLPAANQIYAGISTLKGNMHAFHLIYRDLVETNQAMQQAEASPARFSVLTFQQRIELKNVTFNYPKQTQPALNNVSLSIAKNQSVGFVGSSGSGKSTAIDVLLGLIPTDQGALVIDNQALDNQAELKQWQAQIAYVPQSIFLLNASIAQNVAFNLDASRIDYKRLKEVLSMAQLDDFVKSLPADVNSPVGERGVQLSGGQRQRIGIARALYQQTDTLFMDEATSALDGFTEKEVMQAIEQFWGKKTMIIAAHRLSTIKKCDLIYVFSKGEVVAQGNYDELHNDFFKQLDT